MFKVAMLGCGSISSAHVNGWKVQGDRAKMIAVADLLEDRRNARAADFGAKAYETADALLAAEKPDIVDICLPTALHLEYAVKAMRAGAHVLCEKPLCLSAEKAQELLAVEKETGKRMMVAHVVRFIPQYVYLRKAIEEQYPEMSEIFAESDSLGLTAGELLEADSLAMAAKKKPDEWVPREFEFNPDPNRAVWMAALFPGLGQVYNRRYWKLPIIVGGYLGLAYATNWNNGMLRDYSKAYGDLLDSDPETRSYMDLFAPGVKEENLDKSWLQNVIRSRKNYFRRNRDLCIICMIGVYLLAMVDAYVDASLSHFDITPELTMDVAPALLQDGRGVRPSIGMVWAFNF